MNAKIDPLGRLVLTTGWNFSFKTANDLFIADEQTMIQHVQKMIGIPFKDEQGNIIGKVKDYSHLGGSSQFYLHIVIDDRYKEIMLMKLNPKNAGISIGDSNGKKN